MYSPPCSRGVDTQRHIFAALPGSVDAEGGTFTQRRMGAERNGQTMERVYTRRLTIPGPLDRLNTEDATRLKDGWSTGPYTHCAGGERVDCHYLEEVGMPLYMRERRI